MTRIAPAKAASRTTPGTSALERQRAEQDVGEQADHLRRDPAGAEGYCPIITASVIADSSSVLSTRCGRSASGGAAAGRCR